ncbi:MAG: hypothetical protein FJX53_06160 [Alphaproteobacteria bacterium]|nr:hypothetical protein [Alphaproteobacteria bacterium]
MSDHPDEPARRPRPAPSRVEREARTAAALRANLRRRKAQERARETGGSPPDGGEPVQDG